MVLARQAVNLNFNVFFVVINLLVVLGEHAIAFHLTVEVLTTRLGVHNHKVALGVGVFDVQVDLVLLHAAVHLDRGCGELLNLGFVEIDCELLVRLNNARHTAYGMELNVVERKVVTYLEIVGVEVDNRNLNIVGILVGIESGGALVPDVVAVFLSIKVKHFAKIFSFAVILDAELQLCGVVHLAVVVDVCRPEREHVRCALFYALGRFGPPRAHIAAAGACGGVKQGEVLTGISVARQHAGVSRRKVECIAHHGKAVLLKLAAFAVLAFPFNTRVQDIISVEILLCGGSFCQVSPEVIVANGTLLTDCAIARGTLITAVIHQVVGVAGYGIKLLIGVCL